MDRIRRALASLIAVCGLLLFTPGPAAAGGSTWNTDAGHYAPGETARIWASVSWGHNPDLGEPTDGPYSVWLSGPGAQEWSYGAVPANAVYVGDIEIDAIEVNVGPHVASVAFTVPDLPDGTYDIVHCDRPCTTQLGDITFGELIVDRDGVLPAPTTATARAPAPATTMLLVPSTTPPTTVPPPTTRAEPEAVAIMNDEGDRGSSSGLALALMTVGLLGVVAAGLVLRARRPTSPSEVVA